MRPRPASGFPAVALFLALAALPESALAKEPLPSWLAQAVASPVPSYDPKVLAVVLHQEETLSLDAGGRVEGTTRFAVRILRYEGRMYATGRQHYRTDGGSIREVRAWMIHGPGEVREYGKKEAVDMAAVGNDVYNEERIRAIDGSGEADVGAVFGFEASFEERQFSGQFSRGFQGELPALLSRFTLEVPAGWSVKGVMFNHPDVAPSVTGSTYTWELRDLPWIEEEPARPAVSSLAPWLGVDARAPAAAPAPVVATFESWDQVASWLDRLTAPMAQPSPAITAKARSLAPSGATPMDRIRAIGRYVQDLGYIAIQMGLSRGEGYRPHAASDVFAKSYGDCKDKANLLKTMLSTVGIESYLVVICADDRGFVRKEWPSPQQFNHCIVAIRAADDSSGVVLSHAKLGPLLFFDPTDPETPVGSLPEEEQGSWALLIDHDAGDLVRVPRAPPERNRTERTIDAEIDSTGTIRGSLHQSSLGREATSERTVYHRANDEAYRGVVEARVRRGAANASVSTVQSRDDERRDRFDLDVAFTAGGYAQIMGRGLMIFRPAIIGRIDRLSLDASSRKYPIVLDGWNDSVTSRTRLPAAFEVEELPKPVMLDTPFGSYTARAEAREGMLHFTRSLRIKSMPVPAEQYESLRRFFESVRAAESTPVVLARRGSH